MSLDKPPKIAFRGIEKRYPGVMALRGVTFSVAAGACHALMGENGAGKSTLGKILAGLIRADGGYLEMDGVRQRFRSPQEARQARVGIVHQELALCPNLSVAENICLYGLPQRGLAVDRAALLARACQFLNQVGAQCDPQEELAVLSTGQAQLVQIAATLAAGANIIVLDEPTSSLSLAETQHLGQLIAKLREQGATLIYVSHRMEEIFRFCDSATVLRDGAHVATMPLAGVTADELVRLMIGRSVAEYFPAHTSQVAGDEQLCVRGLSSLGKFHNVNFELRAGEVLGVAGLVGSGRSEVAQGIFGMDPAISGEISVDGKPVRIRHPREAIALGIGLVGEDRKRQGLIPEMSCAGNISLSALHCPGNRGFWGRLVHCLGCPRRLGCLRVFDFIRIASEQNFVANYFQRLRIRAASPEVPATTLSGGNQQKLILARCLARGCRVLMLDEPTRGVDVGAKAEIHRLIDELAQAGHAILMISSELPEVLNLSSRVLVMRGGRVAGTLARAEANPEKVMRLMAGQGALHRNEAQSVQPAIAG